MKKLSTPFQAFLQATGLVVYIGLVVSLMNYLGNRKSDDVVYAPVVFLLLFVLSAIVSGGLVMGRAAVLFCDKNRKQAFELVAWSVVWITVYFGLFLAITLHNT